MRQRRDRLRLALEPRQRVGIRGERLRQHLDRDVALELRVPRPVDLPHPARAERREDLVGTEASPGWECHRMDARRMIRRGSYCLGPEPLPVHVYGTRLRKGPRPNPVLYRALARQFPLHPYSGEAT